MTKTTLNIILQVSSAEEDGRSTENFLYFVGLKNPNHSFPKTHHPILFPHLNNHTNISPVEHGFKTLALTIYLKTVLFTT